MKYLTMLIPLIFVLQGCNKGLTEIHKSDECQQYYSFIKSQWEKQDGYYTIKGDPQYLYDAQVRNRYFNDACWKYLPKKRVEKILGEPNRMDDLKNGAKVYVYCITAKCDRTFQVSLSADGIVQFALPNPSRITQD